MAKDPSIGVRRGGEGTAEFYEFPSTIALLPWGDVVEDFLDEIGISLESFCTKMTGGWLFGYADALRRRGVGVKIICFSERVEGTVRRLHEPTGAEFILIRASPVLHKLRGFAKDPYGMTLEQMFGERRRISRPAWSAAQTIAPYLATPVGILSREIRLARCSAILCQEYETPRFDAAVLAGGLNRIPVFATFQGGTWHRSRLEKILRPMALERSAGLIIGSSAEIQRVQECYQVPSEKIAQIFNPLDLSEWRPVVRDEARHKLGISATARVAVWHGRIDVRVKGLDVLLAAWKQICQERIGRELLLLLVGSGSGADALEAEIQRSSVPNIRWMRDYILDRSEIRRCLSAGDVYAFPSRREGFPVAPLEAMACGLPVVAAAAPGMADILQDGEESGGIVVPIADAAALARNLGALLDDADKARLLGARARQRVEYAFSLETVADQLHGFLLRRGGWSR
jgi:glycosyltransferase involved in cell wall biosynthesis